jgi:hypothetical protein
MTINIITPNGSGDSLVYTCPRTAIAAEVTGSEVSSGEGKLEFKTTTSGTSATKMTIDGAGAVTLAAPLPVASGGTGSTTGAIYIQTAVASTSGSTIDFTGIPAGVKRVTLMLSLVSTNGTVVPLVQIGPSGGVETSGYLGMGSTNTTFTNQTTGAGIGGDGHADRARSGSLTINLVTGSTWVFNGFFGDSTTGRFFTTAANKTITGDLSIVRLNVGANTFDAGSVNISWEF